ncbi:hypothetical protein CsSME_00044711 [Camellia sinensis var. sinensis]
MQGRRALSLNTYFSHRRCEFTAEEKIIKEIQKVETYYSYYTREQKRSLVRQRLQYLSHAARKEALHQFPAESGESHYPRQNDNQPMEVEQPLVQPGITPTFPIEVSSEHIPPSPIYTPRSSSQEIDSVDKDPEEDFDWSGNED